MSISDTKMMIYNDWGVSESYYLKRGQKSKNTSPTLIWTSFLLSFCTKNKVHFKIQAPLWLQPGIAHKLSYSDKCIVHNFFARMHFLLFLHVLNNRCWTLTHLEFISQYCSNWKHIDLNSSFGTKQSKIFMWDLATSSSIITNST